MSKYTELKNELTKKMNEPGLEPSSHAYYKGLVEGMALSLNIILGNLITEMDGHSNEQDRHTTVSNVPKTETEVFY